jgi:arginyl-tRNA synthetase
MAKEGLSMVQSRKDIFIESQGAVIFPGENYGLHTRVFINSKGLPTYEAKELALNKKKFELYPMDLSIVITADEQSDYFKVLLKVMEIMMPEVAAKTKHVAHGVMRLPSGKMSSRTGTVITADSLIDQTKEKLEERINKDANESKQRMDMINEAVALGALKCSILRQSPGNDIAFDFDKSLSLEGDSGPYLQYSYVRALNILNKADKIGRADYKFLDSEEEIALILKLIKFPYIVKACTDSLSSNGLVTYLFDLARTMNRFYEAKHVLSSEDGVKDARLGLVTTVSRAMKMGLNLLGIQTVDYM